MTNPARHSEEKVPAIKLAVFQYLIALVLVILISGLWRLQVLGAQNYRALAQANRVRKVPILAPRGKIYDREGRLIVDNYPSVTCFLVPEQARYLQADLPLIASGLHMDVEQIQSTLRHYRHTPNYQPIPLKSDITPDELAFIAAHGNELPELETIDEQRRLYPSNGFAAHLIGYVGEVSEEMLDDPRYAFYQPGDVVGRSGVEEAYDPILRGQDGSRDIVVDSHGRELGVLGTEVPTPGTSLKLTIDLDIQEAAEKALGQRNGAIVAIDPRTGEVLAMVSRPTFDPNDFAIRIHRDEWNKLINDPEHPLLNKAIQAQLAPGSTFKIIEAVAGLQEGIAQNLIVDCHGGENFYGRFFKCWISARHQSHGITNITKGIFQSCDVYFYTLAEKLGIDKIAEWAHKFGLGEKTGIDLPDEVAGIMPSPEWKMRNYHQKWFAGETISVGIGQGAIAATPIQLVRAIAGIASDGALKRPHVVFPDEVPASLREYYQEQFPGSGNKTVPISYANWVTVTDAMSQVLSFAGTAGFAHLNGVDVAGKTGSAQTMSNALAQKLGHAHTMDDNAWFVGVSPRRNPEIAVCILWEKGAEGYLSARLAAQVIEAYVDKQRRLGNNLRPPVQKRAVGTPHTPNAPAPRTTAARAQKTMEMAGVWNAPADSPAAIAGQRAFPLPPGPDGQPQVLRGARFLLTPSAASTTPHAVQQR